MGTIMGKILVDGHPEALDISPGATVASVFELVRERIVTRGRVIVEIILNEQQSLTWGDGNPSWALAFGPDFVLSLHCDTPLRLSTSLLEQAITTLPAIAEQHRAAAVTLRGDDQPAGIEQMLAVVPWWQDLQRLFANICSLLQIDLQTPEWQSLNEQLASALERLSEQLGELREAADIGDFVLLADLMEYELAPLAEEWQDLCEHFLDRLRQRYSAKEEGSQ